MEKSDFGMQHLQVELLSALRYISERYLSLISMLAESISTLLLADVQVKLVVSTSTRFASWDQYCKTFLLLLRQSSFAINLCAEYVRDMYSLSQCQKQIYA